MILIMEANPEKLQVRLMRFCMIIRRRFAIRVTQICIWMALDEDGNVEDPHYQTAAVYRRVAKHIEKGCKGLVEQWKLQPPKPERLR